LTTRDIRVIHLTEALNIGGLERNILMLIQGLAEHGWDVSIWCLSYGGPFVQEFRNRGIDVRVLRVSRYYHPLHLAKLWRELRAARPAIVHAHGDFAGIFGRIATILAGVPHVLMHGQNRPGEDQYARHVWQNRVLTGICDGIIACSYDTMAYYLEEEGVPPPKVTTVHNPVDTELFRRVPAHGVKTSLGWDEHVVLAGTVARMTKVKGHTYLIKAAPEIIASVPEARFVFVGDGPERPNLEREVHQLGLENYFCFTGMRDDVPRLLSAMDLFVLPTATREGLPLSIAEAMACGLPVVATDVGGVREAVLDRETGFLVPPCDVKALTRAILALLQDERKRREFGRAGHEYCLREYSADLMVRRVEAIYENLLKARRLSQKPIGEFTRRRPPRAAVAF